MSESIALQSQIVGTGAPLVILHGLFGSGRNWGGIARRLADRRQVHLLDARNHGGSPWAPTMTYPDMAGDLGTYIEAAGLAPVDLIGHSMGGKTSMVLALTRPALVRRLIMIDIAPVEYRHGAQEPYAAYIAAMRALDLKTIRRRAEAEAALSNVIHDDSMRAFIVQNLESHEDGYRWRINLDAVESNLPALTGFPKIESHYDGPATTIAGELSNYVRPRDKAEIHRLFPAARIVVIEGAGHWPHADQPDRLMALLEQALIS
jgi:pimeloyl-ACP methyl ester carboxylesterase